MTSRSSRRNAPKNGTTGHSGIARARASARSYLEDRSADERYSNTGSGSLTLCQKGFNLFDLQHKNFTLNYILILYIGMDNRVVQITVTFFGVK